MDIPSIKRSKNKRSKKEGETITTIIYSEQKLHLKIKLKIKLAKIILMFHVSIRNKYLHFK